jgi:hypothetical protein
VIEARRYTPELESDWNRFVARSKNGVFLFDRGYMDYHADRFTDHSLVFLRDEELVAVFPANLDAKTLVSHGGLTFGGLVTDYWMKTSLMMEIVDSLIAYGRAQGMARILYKAIPHIYHVVPAEEDLYALFRAGARLVRRDVALTIDQRGRELYRDDEAVLARASNSRMRNRVRNLRKAREAGVVVERGGRGTDLREFVEVLEEVLMTVHGARPVHSHDELDLLFERFPDQIKLYVARRGGTLLAGAVIYESNRNVAHAQYSANSAEGRKLRALDVVFEELSDRVYRDWPYFDFGTSVEDEGRTLNARLAEYKESQGGRAVSYDYYELPL